MKYICLGYMNEEVWETLSESERQTFMDECFGYDDELRQNGHFAGPGPAGSPEMLPH